MKKKTKKVLKPRNTVVPHGAVNAVKLDVQKRGYPQVALRFATTSAIEERYPVHFYGLSKFKELHAYLGQVIAYCKANNLQ